MNEILNQSAARRTFAIISHPDAGKTTLTEKFLLYGGAIQEAGAVRAKAGLRKARSDWMELERQRGISISSTVLQFNFQNNVINLLDTPGHKDFSEDTYRVFEAAEFAIMVLDAAKGIESQTLKLFEVCRNKNLPILTFINKFDRPGKDILELVDEIEDKLQIQIVPITWPVGIAGDFSGVINTQEHVYNKITKQSHGTKISDTKTYNLGDLSDVENLSEFSEIRRAMEELALFESFDTSFEINSFLKGGSTPLFCGSALTKFGVDDLLKAVLMFGPPPNPKLDINGNAIGLDSPFSGTVFKIQANMNPNHRDQVVFVRVCSGKFERGQVLIHAQTGDEISTRHTSSIFGSERETLQTAYPGDIIGLVNAKNVAIGDTLYFSKKVVYPPIPKFAPEIFTSVRVLDISKTKQFKKGIEQLEKEGVIQLFHDINGDSTIILGAVGQMQFEVANFRLEHEFNAKIQLSYLSYPFIKKTDQESLPHLLKLQGIKVLKSSENEIVTLFESQYRLQRIVLDKPEIHLYDFHSKL